MWIVQYRLCPSGGVPRHSRVDSLGLNQGSGMATEDFQYCPRNDSEQTLQHGGYVGMLGYFHTLTVSWSCCVVQNVTETDIITHCFTVRECTHIQIVKVAFIVWCPHTFNTTNELDQCGKIN